MRIRFFFHEVLNNHFLSILYTKGSLLDTVLSNDMNFDICDNFVWKVFEIGYVDHVSYFMISFIPWACHCVRRFPIRSQIKS